MSQVLSKQSLSVESFVSLVRAYTHAVRELNAQLTQYRAELAALKQNTTMNPDEQRAKIEQLKAEIRKRLALLAQAA